MDPVIPPVKLYNLIQESSFVKHYNKMATEILACTEVLRSYYNLGMKNY